MLNALKRQWRELKAGRPGHRFQERYELLHKQGAQKSWSQRFFIPAVGVILMLIGIFFLFVPGPGLPLLILGAGFLAERSRFLARTLDWLELRARKLFSLVANWWRRASIIKRNTTLIAAVSILGGLGYGAYYFLFGRS